MAENDNTARTITRHTSPVKEKLLAYGWSVPDLASHLGVSRQAIRNVVLGLRISPLLQEAISKVVGVRSEKLFGDLWWVPRATRWLRNRQEASR